MKIVGNTSELGESAEGWVKLTAFTDPNTGNIVEQWRGPYSTRAEALTAFATYYTGKAWGVQSNGGSSTLCGFTITVVPLSWGDVATPVGDVKQPSYSIVPIEKEIPISEIDVPSGVLSETDIKCWPKLIALWRAGDIAGINAYVNENNCKKIAYWIVNGRETKTQTTYNASVTRFMKLGNSVPSGIFTGVDTVKTWSGVTSHMLVSATGLPEPTMNGKSLQWLVRAPQVDRFEKWLQIRQNYEGAYRFPNFYQGGTWVPDESIFPLKV